MYGVAAAVVLGFITTQSVHWPSIIDAAVQSVVRLEMQKGEDTGLCSGVVIHLDPDLLATMAHCTGTDPKAISLTANGRNAELIYANALLDLAVVKFHAKKERVIKLAADTPPTGTPVALLGFAYGSKQLHAQFGHVSLPLDQDSGRLMLDVTVLRGDSGGMAINSDGELVGMTSAYKMSGGYLTVMAPVEAVRDFVKAYLPKPTK